MDRGEAIRAIHEANEASSALRLQLRRAEAESERMAAAIGSETSVSQWLADQGEGTAQLRSDTHDLLMTFQRARHAELSAILLPSLAEGMSIADIGRAFGVSRQLASRWVREARSMLPAPTLL